jgi:hypothetical protein
MVAGEDVEQDAKVKAFLTEFEQQFRLMEAASDRFRQSLPEANLAKLRTLKDRYEKALVALRPVNAGIKTLDGQITRARKTARTVIAKRDKVKSADVAAEDVDAEAKVLELLKARQPLVDKKAPLEAEKEAVRKQLKPVFQPWLDKIQEKIDPIREGAAKEGIALDHVPTKGELETAVRKLKAIDEREKQLLARPTSKSAGRWTSDVSKWQAEIAPLLAEFDKALGAAPTMADGKPLSALARLEQAQRLKPWLLPGKELGVWTSLSRNLAENAHFVFGGLEGGKPQLELKSGDPSVAQLLGVLDLSRRKTDEGGFFNPDPEEERDGFNFLFFKTMVKHGFDPGAAWGHGSTDPMHFDFAEGWRKFVT